MSNFNPDAFMDNEVSESNATQMIPCPEFDEVIAYIEPGSIKPQQKDRKDGDGKTTFVNLQWNIDNEDARQVTGREKVLVRQTIFIDLTEDGAIATGEGVNVALGKLREATDLNEGPFTFRMLEGKQAKLKIGHGSTDDGTPYAEVRGVKHVDA